MSTSATYSLVNVSTLTHYLLLLIINIIITKIPHLFIQLITKVSPREISRSHLHVFLSACSEAFQQTYWHLTTKAANIPQIKSQNNNPNLQISRLTITRTFTDHGRPVRREEVVTNPELIRRYLKEKDKEKERNRKLQPKKGTNGQPAKTMNFKPKKQQLVICNNLSLGDNFSTVLLWL